MSIDVIKGADIRRNRARSWFWQKQKQKDKKSNDENENNSNNNNINTPDDDKGDLTSTTRITDTDTSSEPPPSPPTEKADETFRDYVEKNGIGGKEVVIGGRISLAHEDSDGYADAILQFLFDQ